METTKIDKGTDRTEEQTNMDIAPSEQPLLKIETKEDNAKKGVKRNRISKRNKWEIRDLGVMDRGLNIGAGTYGVIFQAYDDGFPVALKKINRWKERSQEGFPVTAIREIMILKYLCELNHENVVDLREIIVYDEEYDDEEDKELNKSQGFENGDVFMVFELVEYDLSGMYAAA